MDPFNSNYCFSDYLDFFSPDSPSAQFKREADEEFFVPDNKRSVPISPSFDDLDESIGSSSEFLTSFDNDSTHQINAQSKRAADEEFYVPDNKRTVSSSSSPDDASNSSLMINPLSSESRSAPIHDVDVNIIPELERDREKLIRELDDLFINDHSEERKKLSIHIASNEFISKYGLNVLCLLIYFGKEEIIKENLKYFRNDLNFSLQLACYMRATIKIVKRLIDEGADVNACLRSNSKYGFSTRFKSVSMNPLHFTCNNGDLLLSKLLIERGAKLYKKDSVHLRAACASGNLELAELLLKKGLSPIFDYSYKGPLAIAVEDNDLEMFRLLIRYGAYSLRAQNDGKSLISFILEKSDPSRKEFLKVLLDGVHITEFRYILPPFIKDSFNNFSSLEWIEFLVEKGADLNNTNYYGDVLHLFSGFLKRQIGVECRARVCIGSKYSEVVEYLKNKGIDLKKKNKSGLSFEDEFEEFENLYYFKAKETVADESEDYQRRDLLDQPTESRNIRQYLPTSSSSSSSRLPAHSIQPPSTSQTLSTNTVQPISTIHLIPNSDSLQSSSPQFVQSEIRAGVDAKYLDKDQLPALPIASVSQLTEKANPTSKVNFSRALKINQDNRVKNHKTCTTLSFSQGSELLFYSSNNRPIETNTKCAFVFAGRKENGNFPISAGVRVIAVMTEDEYSSLTLPENIDALVIRNLKSETHGNYKEKIGLINSRRIAAFLFSQHQNLESMMVMDDNLENINLFTENNGRDPLENVYHYLSIESKSNQTVCISVPTYLHGQDKPYTLGSKLFLYDIKSIRGKLKSPEEMFYLCYGQASGNFWGQDYFIQLVLRNLFSNEKHGHFVALIETINLVRSSKHKNATKQIAKRAQAHLQNEAESQTENFVHCGAGNLLEIVKKAHQDLCHIIEDNLRWRNESEDKISKADLIKSHATANKLPGESVGELQNPYPDFLNALSDHLSTNHGHYPHQVEALTSLSKNLNNCGCITMATGTGKTRVQAALAHTMLLTNPKQPVFIVEPTIHLLKQSYKAFKKYFKEKRRAGLDESCVLKVSSSQNDIHATVLNFNTTLKNKNVVILFCAQSYKLFMKSKEYFEPALLVLDEYDSAEIKTELPQIIANKNHRSVFGFSATPPLSSPFPKEIYKFSREQALENQIIAPILFDKMEVDFDDDKVEPILNNLANWLKTNFDCNGKLFCETKGIVYLPSIHHCHLAKQKLLESGYDESAVYLINSKNNSCKNDIKSFKKADTGVAFAVNMLRVGFDDKEVKWAFIIKKSEDQNLLAQIAGRVMRKDPKDANKIGYIKAFNNINTNYFDFWVDKEALENSDPDFLKNYRSWHLLLDLPYFFESENHNMPLLFYGIYSSIIKDNESGNDLLCNKFFRKLNSISDKIKIEDLRKSDENNYSSLWLLAMRNANLTELKVFMNFYSQLTIEDLRRKPTNSHESILFLLLKKIERTNDVKALDVICRLYNSFTLDDLNQKFDGKTVVEQLDCICKSVKNNDLKAKIPLIIRLLNLQRDKLAK